MRNRTTNALTRADTRVDIVEWKSETEGSRRAIREASPRSGDRGRCGRPGNARARAEAARAPAGAPSRSSRRRRIARAGSDTRLRLPRPWRRARDTAPAGPGRARVRAGFRGGARASRASRTPAGDPASARGNMRRIPVTGSAGTGHPGQGEMACPRVSGPPGVRAPGCQGPGVSGPEHRRAEDPRPGYQRTGGQDRGAPGTGSAEAGRRRARVLSTSAPRDRPAAPARYPTGGPCRRGSPRAASSPPPSRSCSARSSSSLRV